jgi:hypothetical protein
MVADLAMLVICAASIRQRALDLVAKAKDAAPFCAVGMRPGVATRGGKETKEAAAFGNPQEPVEPADQG